MAETESHKIKINLAANLPPYYAESVETMAIQNALGPMVQQAVDDADEFLRQLNVMEASGTDGGNNRVSLLSVWEKMLGIKADEGKPDQYRRSRILGKLRGQGTTTRAMLENVARSFAFESKYEDTSTTDMELIEHPAEYLVQLKFCSLQGVPSNIDDFVAVIREILPAHLAMEILYKYLLWKDLDSSSLQPLTWSAFDQLALNWEDFLAGAWANNPK